MTPASLCQLVATGRYAASLKPAAQNANRPATVCNTRGWGRETPWPGRGHSHNRQEGLRSGLNTGSVPVLLMRPSRGNERDSNRAAQGLRFGGKAMATKKGTMGCPSWFSLRRRWGRSDHPGGWLWPVAPSAPGTGKPLPGMPAYPRRPPMWPWGYWRSWR